MTGRHRRVTINGIPRVNPEQTSRVIDVLTDSQPTPGVKAMGARAVFEGFMPMDHVSESHLARYIREELEEKIIGQQSAIDAIAAAMDRDDVRLEKDPRPLATLAFLGPTGVGKSETAKTLAEATKRHYMNSLIKIDCSDFSHGHEVASLVGSPPGYVSREQVPILDADKVDDASVILFDEIEKGSPELHRLMLQIMGDGTLRLNNGKTAHFRHAAIILTSNLGAKEMAQRLSDSSLGFGNPQKKQPTTASLEQVAKRSFTEYFAPEFINRIDSLVVFQPLSEDTLREVLSTKLYDLNKSYIARFGVKLSLSDGAETHLVARAREETHLGARPLIRAFESEVQSQFGRYIGSGYASEGTHIRVFHASEVPDSDADTQQLVFMSAPDASLRRKRKKTSTEVVVATKLDSDSEEHSIADQGE